MKSVTKSATFFGQKGFGEFLSTLIVGNARSSRGIHRFNYAKIQEHKLPYFCYQRKLPVTIACDDKFQKFFSTNWEFSTSSEETGSTPTHFKELAGKHPLPEVEEEKQLHEDRKKANDYILPHPIWTEKDLHSITISHKEPQGKVDKLAYYTVQALRLSFDIISMYKIGRMTENKWLTRIIMLETVAGVPGMVGAMTRHFHSLRRMRRDHGWIHTLLEEAENERMHLMTALELKQPGIIFRGMVLLMQGVFVNMFFISYLLSPRFCHRFVGYLEEEAVKTYTHCLETIDSGRLSIWKTKPAPLIARKYWKLKDDCTMRDVILAIRADEAHHRKVNHTFASMHLDQQNPFEPWERKL